MTTYWVRYDVSVINVPGPASPHSLVFQGLPLALTEGGNVATVANGGNGATNVPILQIVFPSQPQEPGFGPAPSFGEYSLWSIGIGSDFLGPTSPNSYQDYVVSIGQYYLEGSQPDPTVLVSPQLGTSPPAYDNITGQYTTFQYNTFVWALVTITGNLFSYGRNTVDFNNLIPGQQTVVSYGADLYHGFGGNDVVTLPSVTNYNVSLGSAGGTLNWDPSQTFVTGSLVGDIYQVFGSDGNYNIALGAGSDSVTINGNGNSNITAGSGSDTITINGTGTNSVATGSGPETLSISGGGTLVVKGNLSGGSPTIGSNSTLEFAANDTVSINLNSANAGTVQIDSGSTLTVGGLDLGATGSKAALTNDNASLIVSAGAIVGDAGAGSLSISDGGKAAANFIHLGEVAGGNGTVTLTGPGSSISVSQGIEVGYGGTGNLTVTGGASLSTDFLNIGHQAGSKGTVDISGAGSSVDTTGGQQFQNILVGIDGLASLTIENGATAKTNDIEIAGNFHTGITDTLDLNNAALTVSQYLVIGQGGSASATVENGAILTVGAGLDIASAAGDTAALTIDGSTLNDSGPLVVGDSGSGSLTVQNGSTIGSTVFIVALNSGSTGTVTINSDASSNLTLGAGTAFITVSGTGTTKVAAGTGTDTFSISGGPSGGIGNVGTLVVNGNLTGGSATIGANSIFELNGASTGTVTFDPKGTNETLKIDGTTMPTGVISGFGAGNTIDLRGVSFDSKSATVLQTSNNKVSLNNVLHVFANGKDFQLDLNPNDAFVGGFALAPDGLGGTYLTFTSAAPVSGFPNFQATSAYSTSIDPYDAVVRVGIATDPSGGGSGFIIGPHTILTAAHVVARNDGTLYGGITIKGWNQSSFAVQNVYPDPDWAKTIQGAVASPTPYDWAVINVSQDLSSFGQFRILTDYSGGSVNVTGYPQTLQNNEVGKVSPATVPGVLQEDPNFNAHGESGGPLWFYDGSTAWAVGLANSTSQAVQITSDDWKQIQQFMSGKVINHYISGATVFADANGTGELAANDLSTTTDSAGSFSLTGGTGPLIAFGGTDISTGLPFKGQLSAPSDSIDITPLTTLLTNLSSDPSAQQKVLSNLGLSSALDLTTFDPIAAAQGGSADGAATEIAGEKVYDTVEMIASLLAGTGGSFAPSLKAAFSSLASALDGTGLNLSDKAAVSGLITQVAHTESISLASGVADALAGVIAASNSALDHVLQTDQPGSQLLSDAANVELVMQGAASTAITNAGGSLLQLQTIANLFAGTNLSELISQGLVATPAAVSGTEGAVINATVATFADVNSNAASSNFTAAINWGDGVTTTGTVVTQNGLFAVSGGHTYAGEGNYQPVVTITDAGGHTTAATSTATVSDAPLTATPATISGTEGGAINNATIATFSDGNPNAAASDFSATINWGDGATTSGTVVAQNGSFVVQGGHTYLDEGSYQVGVSINDVGGAIADTTTTAAIADALITANPAILSGTEGGAINNATVATFSDGNPNAAASDFSATINWGDGTTTTGTVVAQNGGFAVQGGHTYLDEGSYQVGVTVNDVGGSTASATSTAAIADADVLSGQGLSIDTQVGQALNDVVVAKFTDTYQASQAGDFVAKINWGDGTISTGIVSGGNGAFSVAGSHTYAVGGQDSATVTLIELAPGDATATVVTNIDVRSPPPVIVSDGGGSTASAIITDDTKFVDQMHATDLGQDTPISYSIVGGANEGLFTIDPNTGNLSFKSDPIDGKSYQVEVAASGAGSQAVQTINVKVANGIFESGNPGVADTFVFKSDFGLAIVNNFDASSANHDVVEINHSFFHGATAGEAGDAALKLVADHSLQLGHDLFVFTDAHDVIDLKNTNIHSLTSHDFVIT